MQCICKECQKEFDMEPIEINDNTKCLNLPITEEFKSLLENSKTIQQNQEGLVMKYLAPICDTIIYLDEK